MAVRNFWIEAHIDGRKTVLSGGPRAKDGGFDLTIYIRDNGGIEKALLISGGADGEDLHVSAFDTKSSSITVRTKR